MTAAFTLSLLFLAMLLFGLAAAGVGHPRAHLGWLGAAVATLAYVLANWPT